jgi:hypothetical protein
MRISFANVSLGPGIYLYVFDAILIEARVGI